VLSLLNENSLEPRRIAAIPALILEVIVNDPTTATTTIRPEHTSPKSDIGSTTTTVAATTSTDYFFNNNNTNIDAARTGNSKAEIEESHDTHPKPTYTNHTHGHFGGAVTETHQTQANFEVYSNPIAKSNGSLVHGSQHAVDTSAQTPNKTSRLSDVSLPSAQPNKNGYCHNQSENNNPSAIDWVVSKANQGSAEAQIELGRRYTTGQGVRQNLEKALEWYLKAAEQGNANAQCCVGFMFERGQGVPRDDTKAMSWYLKAAIQGSAPAQINIGFMYERAQDYAKAISWYHKPALQGFSQAQTNLGFLYEHGHGTAQSYPKAIEWYLKAAEQGAPAAQMNLGYLYHYGRGVPQDFAKAMEWYQKAAAQGDPQVLHQIEALKKQQTSTQQI
jgi:TPR repeat protein